MVKDKNRIKALEEAVNKGIQENISQGINR